MDEYTRASEALSPSQSVFNIVLFISLFLPLHSPLIGLVGGACLLAVDVHEQDHRSGVAGGRRLLRLHVPLGTDRWGNVVFTMAQFPLGVILLMILA